MHPQLSALFSLFAWSPGLSEIPTVDELNHMAHTYWEGSWKGPVFVEDKCVTDSRYYEQIIAQDNIVPTRENSWHDVFNAFIWILFPQAKKQITQYHYKDIEQFGVHPRTPRRNHITHFDECGLILAVPEHYLATGEQILSNLANHQWQASFVDNQSVWGQSVVPIIFGHAIYEMLMAPYIGLTAKWLAVTVPSDFACLSLRAQYQVLDIAIVERLNQFNGLAHKAILKPIPLLGLPGWFEKQNSAFYQNTRYFRPLASNAPVTKQLPLQ